MDISLDLVLPSKKTPLFSSFSTAGISLISLLQKYFEIDNLNDKYSYECENCSKIKPEPGICSEELTQSSEDEEQEDVISSLSDSLSSITILSPAGSSTQLKRNPDNLVCQSSISSENIKNALNNITLRKADKWYRIEIFPEILVLHLKRFFAVSRGRFTKSSEKVNIPPVLDMSQFYNGYPHTPCSAIYELYALVIHVGSSMESGHYVAHVRTDTNWGSESKPSWYYCSDTTVHKMDITKAPSSDAYILFYKRIS